MSFMKYNTDIMYRDDIVSYTRKNREKSIFYLTHYTYRYILKLHHINIFKHLSNHSNYYRMSIGPLKLLSTIIEHLSNYHRTSIRPLLKHIEHLSNVYRTTIEHLSNICRTTSNVNWTTIKPHRTTFNHYWTPIGPLLDYIIEYLSDHYCTTIEHLSNHYQTFIKLLLNIFQILIICYITIIYLSILNYRGINKTYLC